MRAGPGNAIVLASTTPFFVVILGWFVAGERISWQGLGGLVIGFLGVVLVVSSQLGGDQDGLTAIGMAFALAAAIGWAVGTFVVKELVVRHPEVDLIGVTAGQYLVGGAALFVLSSSFEGFGGTEWSSGELWVVGGVRLDRRVRAGDDRLLRALRRLSATTATAWSFLSPVVAVLLEIALGNMPRAVVLAGMVVTIAGVAIVNAAPAAAGCRSAEANGDVSEDRSLVRRDVLVDAGNLPRRREQGAAEDPARDAPVDVVEQFGHTVVLDGLARPVPRPGRGTARTRTPRRASPR